MSLKTLTFSTLNPKLAALLLSLILTLLLSLLQINNVIKEKKGKLAPLIKELRYAIYWLYLF
jgi:hypothetical protein